MTDTTLSGAVLSANGRPRTGDLSPLLRPDSVAVVGASDSRHYSRSIIANLRQHGFSEDKIFPVNPRYPVVSGLPCYPALGDLPSAPEVVAVLVAKSQARPTLEQAVTAGARAAVVIADGYGEESVTGQQEQDELSAFAASAKLALLGPNTLGYVIPSTGAGLWCAGRLPSPLEPGGTAILAQSSGMLNLVMSIAGDRRLGIRAAMSVGNGALIGLPELIQHFARDESTSVLALIVESTDRPRALATALATARRAGKPLVVLKIGVSELGRRNAVAHTGRMAGPQQGWSAALDRLGAVQVRDLDDLVETLTLFEGTARVVGARGPRRGNLGVAVATISGGETSLICDVAAQEGLALAPLADGTLTALRSGLNKHSLIGNPLDLQNSRTSRPEVFWQCLRVLCADDAVDLLAVRLNLAEQPTDELRQLYRQVAEVAREEGVNAIVLTRAYERLDRSWAAYFRELKLPFVMTYRNAIRALVRLSAWASASGQPLLAPTAIPVEAQPESAERAPNPLDPGATRAWLAQAGIAYVPSAVAASAVAARQAADRIGYPVAVKAVLPGLVHKSDVGGVALGLTTAAEVEKACEQMAGLVSPGDDHGRMSFEVQRLVSGTEVIVGMTQDPSWGPAVMVGAGGVFAEQIRDVAWDLPPLDEARVREMLEGLQIYPLLTGARGRPPADIAALTELVVRFSAAVAADPSALSSIDLNPVIVGPEGAGAFVVDAALLAPAGHGS